MLLHKNYSLFALFFIWILFVNHSKVNNENYLNSPKIVKEFNVKNSNNINKVLISNDSINQKKWVDSIMSQMTVKEKIAQLFMVAAYSNKDSVHENLIKKLITEQRVGGLIFMQGTPRKQVKLNNQYQSLSNIPLLIGFDGEWGLNMRLDSTFRFPWNLTLGAIQDNDLLEKVGKRIGQQSKRVGIHVNFAPVVDINSNPLNPIIGNRSYGSDKYNVTLKAKAFMKGMQSENVMACAKHFPGHGETDKDSHKTLPSVNLSIEHIVDNELFPFRMLIDEGIASVMTAHLYVPALDNSSGTPASMSKVIITDLLKDKMHFAGLIFTDALNMKGATQYSVPGQMELSAFLAGNDVLLFSENAAIAIDSMYSAYNKNLFDDVRLNHSVRKILNAKYKAGLNKYKPIDEKNLQQDLVKIDDEILYRELLDNAVTLVKTDGNFPIQNLEQRIGYYALGDADSSSFYQMLRQYADVKILNKNLDNLDQFDLVIIGYHKSNDHPWKQYQMNEDEINNLSLIASKTKTLLSLFSSPYALMKVKDYNQIQNVVIGYQNSVVAQELTAQKIFGALKTNGKLPVAINENLKLDMGISTESIGRLSYGIPEEVGMSSQKLSKIDSVAKEIIEKKMAPGMQILVARHGKVIYQKEFGNFTYENTNPVTRNTLYDFASVTKITAGLPMFMQAYEEGKVKLDDTFGSAFPQMLKTNKKDITFREALSHKSGMVAWIPYYKRTLDSVNNNPSSFYYSTIYSDEYPVKVAKDMYANKLLKDTIWNRMLQSDMKSKTYRYSDLFFTMWKDFVERNYQNGLDKMVDSLFYKPMGAYTLTYNPLNKFDLNQIAPTEEDNYFRFQTLQGYVHDMAAAQLGGVSGHAGLFGNANDLAKMMQMYLQNGYYGGKQYFKKSTIDIFNTRYYLKENNRRGLGFDKPQLNKDEKATCGCVSESSFGHSGFTGNYTWADPESGILYVFLSNRTYPTMENNKMVSSNVRTEIQKLIQEAIK